MHTALNAQQRLFSQLAAIPGSVPGLEQAMEEVLAAIIKTLAARCGLVGLRDSKTGGLRLLASSSFEPMNPEVVLQRLAVRGEPRGRCFVLADPMGRPLYPYRDVCPSKSGVVFMAAPLVLAGRPMGLILVDRLFSRRLDLSVDLKMLKVLAQVLTHMVLVLDQHRALLEIMDACRDRFASTLELDTAFLRDILAHAETSWLYTGLKPGDEDAKEPENGRLSLKEVERFEVLSALERNNWVQSRAARELGISLRQMGYKVRNFGLYQTLKERRRQQKEGRSA